MLRKNLLFCCLVFYLLVNCNPNVVEVELSNLKEINFGVTFSEEHSRWLFGESRSPESVLEAIAFELGIKNYRLEAYWNVVQETGPEELNTSSLDWQLEIMQRCGAENVIVCLGQKVPHWPEYHLPEWAKSLPEAEFKQKLLDYLARVVDFYANDPRITVWQVENEPFFDFGQGQMFADQEEFLKKEIQIVKEHDKLNRLVIVTDSGDQGDYIRAAKNADILGLSYYGISYANGYVIHNYGSPQMWQLKVRLRISDKPVWLTELQAEPWGPVDIKSLTVEESYKSMNVERLKKHLRFVLDAGFKDIYFWGAEWWLWMKDKGQPEMWEEIKTIIKNA